MDRDVWMTILSIAVPGLVVWIWALWQKVAAIELDIAKNYHDNKDLENAIRREIAPLLKAVTRIESVIDRVFPQGGNGHGTGN